MIRLASRRGCVWHPPVTSQRLRCRRDSEVCSHNEGRTFCLGSVCVAGLISLRTGAQCQVCSPSHKPFWHHREEQPDPVEFGADACSTAATRVRLGGTTSMAACFSHATRRSDHDHSETSAERTAPCVIRSGQPAGPRAMMHRLMTGTDCANRYRAVCVAGVFRPEQRPPTSQAGATHDPKP